jgi:hypothetical protein
VSAGSDTIPVDVIGDLDFPGFVTLSPFSNTLREVIKFEAISGSNIITLTRGLAGSVGGVAHEHPSNAVVISAPTEQLVDDIFSDIEDLETADTSHAATDDAHHTEYLDADAVSAMGAVGDGNDLNHNRYTDGEVDGIVATHAADDEAHHPSAIPEDNPRLSIQHNVEFDSPGAGQQITAGWTTQHSFQINIPTNWVTYDISIVANATFRGIDDASNDLTECRLNVDGTLSSIASAWVDTGTNPINCVLNKTDAQPPSGNIPVSFEAIQSTGDLALYDSCVFMWVVSRRS